MRKPYRVHIAFRYPAWDEKDGFMVYVRGTSKADANKSARLQARDAGHECVTFSATEITEAEYDRQQGYDY